MPLLTLLINVPLQRNSTRNVYSTLWHSQGSRKSCIKYCWKQFSRSDGWLDRHLFFEWESCLPCSGCFFVDDRSKLWNYCFIQIRIVNLAMRHPLIIRTRKQRQTASERMAWNIDLVPRIRKISHFPTHYILNFLSSHGGKFKVHLCVIVDVRCLWRNGPSYDKVSLHGCGILENAVMIIGLNDWDVLEILLRRGEHDWISLRRLLTLSIPVEP